MITCEKRSSHVFLKERDTAVVGEFDGIGEVFRHVESLLAAFLRLPRIVDVVEFQFAATQFFQRRNGFFQRIVGDFGKDEIAALRGIQREVFERVRKIACEQHLFAFRFNL